MWLKTTIEEWGHKRRKMYLYLVRIQNNASQKRQFLFAFWISVVVIGRGNRGGLLKTKGRTRCRNSFPTPNNLRKFVAQKYHFCLHPLNSNWIHGAEKFWMRMVCDYHTNWLYVNVCLHSAWGYSLFFHIF